MFNRYEAERYLLLAGDLPGYDVRLALRSAGAARGEVIGEVTVARMPVLVELIVQNLGSRELGRWGALLRGQFLRPDRARRPHHDRRLQHRRHATSSRRSSSATISGSAARGSRSARQLTYAWASPDLEPCRRRHRLAHPVRDRRGELPVHPAPDPHPARRDRPRRDRAGYRLQHLAAQPRPAARRLRQAGVRRARPVARQSALHAGRALVAARLLGGGAAGARYPRRQRGLRPRPRALPRPRCGAADTARGRSDRDRVPRQRLWRISADPAAHLRPRPARPV